MMADFIDLFGGIEVMSDSGIGSAYSGDIPPPAPEPEQQYQPGQAMDMIPVLVQPVEASVSNASGGGSRISASNSSWSSNRRSGRDSGPGAGNDPALDAVFHPPVAVAGDSDTTGSLNFPEMPARQEMTEPLLPYVAAALDPDNHSQAVSSIVDLEESSVDAIGDSMSGNKPLAAFSRIIDFAYHRPTGHKPTGHAYILLNTNTGLRVSRKVEGGIDDSELTFTVSPRMDNRGRLTVAGDYIITCIDKYLTSYTLLGLRVKEVIVEGLVDVSGYQQTVYCLQYEGGVAIYNASDLSLERSFTVPEQYSGARMISVSVCSDTGRVAILSVCSDTGIGGIVYSNSITVYDAGWNLLCRLNSPCRWWRRKTAFSIGSYKQTGYEFCVCGDELLWNYGGMPGIFYINYTDQSTALVQRRAFKLRRMNVKIRRMNADYVLVMDDKDTISKLELDYIRRNAAAAAYPLRMSAETILLYDWDGTGPEIPVTEIWTAQPTCFRASRVCSIDKATGNLLVIEDIHNHFEVISYGQDITRPIHRYQILRSQFPHFINRFDTTDEGELVMIGFDDSRSSPKLLILSADGQLRSTICAPENTRAIDVTCADDKIYVLLDNYEVVVVHDHLGDVLRTSPTMSIQVDEGGKIPLIHADSSRLARDAIGLAGRLKLKAGSTIRLKSLAVHGYTLYLLIRHQIHTKYVYKVMRLDLADSTSSFTTFIDDPLTVVTSLAVTGNGRLVLGGWILEDRNVLRVYDSPDGYLLRTVYLHNGFGDHITDLSISPEYGGVFIMLRKSGLQYIWIHFD